MFRQLKLTPTRAAFAGPGPDDTPFPDVSAPMQPSDSLVPFGRRSGLPLPTAYLGAQVLFFAAAPAPTETRAYAETLLPRLPVSRLSPKEKRGSPRCLGHPLRACRGLRPRRVQPPLARSRCGRQELTRSPRHPVIFAKLLTHGPLVGTAESVTVSGARLATGRAGSPLAGRVSHPLDDKQGFMKSSHSIRSRDQPGVHRRGRRIAAMWRM